MILFDIAQYYWSSRGCL